MNQSRVTQLNSLGLLGMSAVLLAAFVMQLSLNELPCPLCLLQRVGFAMVMFGFMLNLVYGPQQRHYGVILLGALFGAAAALRQVSLHVVPGTPGYGSPIFGMHYYTWAFVLFAATIFAVAVLLVMWREEWSNDEYEMTTVGRFACLLAISAVALNVISTFIECGPYQCPDNPVSYWFIDKMS
ncbi:disulfide bond formation protein B [Vibrio marisflavi]|uniref:Disulfide bond formation protein B n=1 Tax=Vibrio marisflavi CECT 7928 TaxID=634439 RepID=A0ABM9A0A3_9VIBR|nr:disulfide bond formation protein B [Vibrio marisflavi]CAH0536295.1 Disulfide bond formation protein B [Vibrio marisflavi CECT 7928]